jgi:hypothetical protein
LLELARGLVLGLPPGDGRGRKRAHRRAGVRV